MTDYLVIADIAGRYDELQLLLGKMPQGFLVFVGDECDRGSQSKQVIDFIISEVEAGRAVDLYSNHADFLVDHYQNTDIYQHGIWLYNGGGPTIDSFNGQVPNEVVSWLARRPLTYKITDISIPSFPEGVLVSHSFVAPHLNLEQACEIAKRPGIRYDDYDFENSIIWNRKFPIRREYFQIAGHNAHWGIREFVDDKGVYAIGIDDSANKKLTGLCLREDNYELYSQDFLEWREK